MKLFKYITIALSSLFMCGCSDYLDNAPDDTLTMEMVFNDRTRTEDWLSGVYNRVPDTYWALLRTWGYDSMGDDLDPSQRWYQWWGNSLNFIIGQWFTSSTWDAAIWKENPIRIRSAYLFIKNAHALPDQGVSEADIERMKNECRFLIAYYYWLMIEAHGSVPFFDDLADVNDPNLMRGQMPFDEMVDWIDAQLVDLSKKLPASYLNESTQFYGRATSIMCLAVRARMLLFAASPLVNGNEWYAGFKNYDGKFRFSQTYDPAKWKRAADANRELIEAAHAAGHDLVREYNADGSIDPFMSCYNVFFLRGDQNPEALFIRSDCDFSEFERHATPRGASGNGGLGVYQTLVDAFAMKDGSLPITGYDGNYGKPIINKESGYTERGFSAQKDIRKTKYNLYRNCPGATVDSVGADGCTYNQVAASGTYNMYVGREPRFYLTVMWNRQWYHQAGREVQMMSNEQDGGPTHDAPQNGYLNRKKVSLEQNNRNGIHPYRPGILYRLGEAYLNYAEALNECDPGNPDILKYLNLIRERAGIPALKEGLSKEEMRAAIQQERRVEFNCEGIRFHDLRRWKIADKYLGGKLYGMNHDGSEKSDDVNNPKAFYKRTYYKSRTFNKRMYLWPVPQAQMDINPNLRQAPGY